MLAKKDLDTARGWYDAGPQAVAEARYARLIELDIIDPAWQYELPPEITNPNTAWRTDVRTDTDAWPPPADYEFYNGKNKRMGWLHARRFLSKS